MKKSTFILFTLLSVPTLLFSQNTLSYTALEAYYNNGIELFEKKAYSAARKEFKNYVEKSSTSLNPNKFNIANAEYYSAVTGLYTGALDADIEVERFVINHSEHPKAKIIFSDLGESFYEKGDYEQAIDYLTKAISFRQDGLDIYELRYKLAVSYYQLKTYEKALPEFNYVKQTVAENAINAAYYAAVINFQFEDYDAALVDLRRVENVNPYKVEVPNWIAQILYRQEKYDDLLAFTEPIIANPDGRKIDEICLLTAEVLFFRDKFGKAADYYDKFREFRRGSVDPQVTFRHGFSLYKNEEYQKALYYFKQIADKEDALGQQAAYYLGISALNVKDLNAALAAFGFAKSLDFDREIKEEAAFNYIKVLVDLKNSTEAVSQLQEYVNAYPNGKYVDTSNELVSDILFETNNLTQAISYIEGLSRKTSKIEAAYQELCYNQGVLDFNLERFDKAIEYFNKAINNPINREIVNNAKIWRAEASFASEKPETKTLYRELLNSGSKEARTKSLYSLGYLSYNEKEYDQARKYFEEYLDQTGASQQSREDALLRIADCYLVQKNFAKALSGYERALSSNRTNLDYALYQKGNTLDFMDRKGEAQDAFNQFSKRFENSRLIDDVLYQRGNLEMDKRDYQSAIASFTEMLRKKPNSILAPDALLKRALAFGNLQNYDRAISDYKLIVKKFGNSKVANEALLGLRDILNITGRSEDFAEIADDYREANPESNSAINLQYEAAKNLFYTEKYTAAISALTRFVANNPSNSNIMEANYLVAESYYFTKETGKAKPFYQKVITDNQSNFVAKSAYRLANIQFEEKDYRGSVSSFQNMLSSSSSKRDEVTAWEGLFKSFYFLGDYDNSIKNAQSVISEGGEVVIGAVNRAHLFTGKSHMQRNNFTQAKESFEKVIALAKDVSGAEAKYFIGEMLYKSGKYDESIVELQKLAQEFNDFIYWYEKAFLLIADNYVAKNDSFMAKATLKSIIENSNTPATVTSAKDKLKAIK
ncbi:Tetratricopeptide repeat-containing protein [Spirosomataceae bacterium TFI 002]|nr:Tetratricopeptide repeat-containing protein [Spirosomataceae bacterium TFI 002]